MIQENYDYQIKLIQQAKMMVEPNMDNYYTSQDFMNKCVSIDVSSRSIF